MRHIRFALRALRKLYGHTPAAEFGPLKLKAVRQSMIDSGLCRNEINRRVRRIARMFKWATSEELIAPSVHQSLGTVAGLRKGLVGVRESKPIRPVDAARVEAIKPHVARQVWAMIQLQRLAGMRPGEVCAVRTCDLDMTGEVWFYTPASHKTEHHGRERTIFLGPRARAILAPWVRPESPTGYLFRPDAAMAEKNAAKRAARKSPMTPSHRKRRPKARPGRAPGDRYITSSYAHAIASACRRAWPHPTLAKVRRKDLTDVERAELKA